MKARSFSLLLLLSTIYTFGTAGCCQKIKLTKTQFPPQDWQLRLEITLSDDLFMLFLKEKPSEDEFLSVHGLPFWVCSDGSLMAMRCHPVITGDLDDDSVDDFISGGPIAFIPLQDQKLAYEYAFRAVQSFDFTNSFAHADLDDSGIDVYLELEINGRFITISYRKIQPNEKLPENILLVLASIRRNLPAEYDRLFDFLSVPKLGALSVEESEKYTRCKIHDEWMKVNELPIVYGVLGCREDYREAEENFFPNANRFSWVGSLVHRGGVEKVKMLYCNSCRVAEKKWVEEHKDNP